MISNLKKSKIVAAATMAFLKDLKLQGLDSFEILSALCLSLVKSSKSLGIPKEAIMNVFSKLWDELDKEDKTFIMDIDIEA